MKGFVNLEWMEQSPLQRQQPKVSYVAQILYKEFFSNMSPLLLLPRPQYIGCSFVHLINHHYLTINYLDYHLNLDFVGFHLVTN